MKTEKIQRIKEYKLEGVGREEAGDTGRSDPNNVCTCE
jgi:hypothetical protein